MVHVSTLFVLGAAAGSVYGMPMSKRIAQTIADSTAQWVKACEAAGGADKCNTISVNAFQTLLAAAGACDQQNAADTMIDLAHTLNNDPDTIKFAQIFAQQPRNSVSSTTLLFRFVAHVPTSTLYSPPPRQSRTATRRPRTLS